MKKENKADQAIEWIKKNGLGGRFGATRERFFAEVGIDERTFLRLRRKESFNLLIYHANKDFVAETERMLATRLLDVALGKAEGNVEAITYLLEQIDPDNWKKSQLVETFSLDYSARAEEIVNWEEVES